MQIQAKIGGILYDRSGKLDSNYLDLELVWVPGSNYKSLVVAVS